MATAITDSPRSSSPEMVASSAELGSERSPTTSTDDHAVDRALSPSTAGDAQVCQDSSGRSETSEAAPSREPAPRSRKEEESGLLLQKDGEAPAVVGTTTQASEGGARPRLAAERRSLSVSTGTPIRSLVLPLSASALPRGQDAGGDQEPSGVVSANPMAVNRLGHSLATMHEELQAADDDQLIPAPLSASAAFAFAEPRHTSSMWDQYHHEGQLRTSRHRSTSSAAALALHTSTSIMDGIDPLPLPTIRVGPSIPARSIWDRDSSSSGAFGPIGRYRTGSSPQAFQPAVQRGLSFSAAQPEVGAQPSAIAIGAPGSNRPGAFSRDRGVSLSSAVPLQNGHQLRLASQLRSHGDREGEGAAQYSGQAAFYAGTTEAQAAGTESRRHSIAGDPTPDISTFNGQRRAVGFEVSRTIGFGSTSRTASEEPLRNRSSFAPFGSGSLALTDDDLAGGSDFDPLQRELDRAKLEQEREHQQQQQQQGRSADVASRVPSGTAAVAGAHATSMPSIFGESRSFNRFGSSPATSGIDFGYSSQGRLAHGGGGGSIDSLSASWDILTPTSTQLGRSPEDRRDTIALMANQLRQTSIGTAREDPRGADDGRRLDEEHAAGTATVKASPGSSPQQTHKASGARSSLSPTAKVFQGGQLGGQMPGEGRSSLNLYDEPYPRQRSSSGTDSGSFGAGVPAQTSLASGYPVGALGGSSAFVPASGAQFGVPAAVGGFVNPYLLPSHSHPAPPQLSDFAISGLASLGPLPPPSGGSGPGFGSGSQPQTDLQDLGKGVPLSSLAKDTPLYIVEFKQGRTDLFFRYRGPDVQPRLAEEPIVKGDLVIVEADRGKDLGSVVNDSITVEQVQSFLAHQSELAMGASGSRSGSEDAQSSGGLGSSPTSSSSTRPTRSINPKRLFTKATPADTSLLYSKAQDEERALQLCITKVNQRGLPMSVVAAEMQWDRRKLTFYYTASMRVDFRDLVKELFRLYKTRIWMCHLGHPSGTGMV
ncbi:hypothetical protein ACQY0O_004669 [Thecaphora frezii]